MGTVKHRLAQQQHILVQMGSWCCGPKDTAEEQDSSSSAQQEDDNVVHEEPRNLQTTQQSAIENIREQNRQERERLRSEANRAKEINNEKIR